MPGWIENNAQWYEQRMFCCSCCGRLIAMHLLIADIDGNQKIFCSEECNQLYRDYVLTERGRNYRVPPNVWKLYEDRIIK